MQTRPLTNENIQSFIDALTDFSRNLNISQRRVTWMLLTLEELLLKYRDFDGCSREFGYRYQNRFGLLTVELSVKGEPLDTSSPAEENDGEGAEVPELLRNLLGELYGSIRFRSRGGWNYITVSLPNDEKKHRLPGSPVIYALVLGVIAGVTLKYLAPEFALGFTENIADPLYRLILDLIRGCTEAFVFVSLIAAISALSDMKLFKKLGKRMMSFFILCSFGMFLLCALICIPVFNITGASQTSFDLSGLLSLLLSSVPTSFITPFVDRNMLQIVLLAIILGVVLMSVNDRMSSVSALLDELKFCLTRLLQYLIKIVPFLVFLSMVKVIITVEAPELARVWKILAVDQGLSIVGIFLFFALVSVKYRVSIASLYSKISPAIHVALSTGSTTASIPELYQVIHPRLGVDEGFANYWIPLSSTLFVPSVIFPLTAYAFFSAECQGVGISLGWVVVLFFMVLVMGIATPKVPGGVVATITIVLAQLGLNSDQLALIMSANVIMLYLDAAFAVVLRCMGAVLVSDRQKLCDLSVLKSDGKGQTV